MSKLKEFENNRIFNVGQLMEKLKQYPSNTKLEGRDADIGGYDFSSAPFLTICYCEETNTLVFGHDEYEVFEAYQKNELSKKEYNQLTKYEDE